MLGSLRDFSSFFSLCCIVHLSSTIDRSHFPGNDNVPVISSNNSGCFVETILRPSQGLVSKDRMPEEFPGAYSCRTLLRNPENRLLRLKVDLALFNSTSDFIQINADSNLWYIDKSCAPCHDDAIEGYEISIEFRLTNGSRMQIRYLTKESVCPQLKILPPLKMKKHIGGLNRKQGDSIELECLTQKDFLLEGANTLKCEVMKNGSLGWDNTLPTCRRVNNCPKVEKNDEKSATLQLKEFRAGFSYHCSWHVKAPDVADFVFFTPIFQPISLGSSLNSNRNSGLAFYDGEGQIKVETGVGLRYRTRDRQLDIYLNLSPKDVFLLRNGTFTLAYQMSIRTCPTIDEDAFPFGTMNLSDYYFIGSNVTFECSLGFSIRGVSVATCGRDGHWTFRAIPECIEGEYGSPSAKQGGSEISNSSTGISRPINDVIDETNMELINSSWLKQDSNSQDPDSSGTKKEEFEGQTVVSKPARKTIGESISERKQLVDSSKPTSPPAEDVEVARKYLDGKNLILFATMILGRGDHIIIASAVLFLLLLIFIVICILLTRHCRRKVAIRENPLYSGRTPRRLNNISFRPSSKTNNLRDEIQNRTFN